MLERKLRRARFKEDDLDKMKRLLGICALCSALFVRIRTVHKATIIAFSGFTAHLICNSAAEKLCLQFSGKEYIELNEAVPKLGAPQTDDGDDVDHVTSHNDRQPQDSDEKPVRVCVCMLKIDCYC